MWNSLVFARQPAEQILHIFLRTPASCGRQLMPGKRVTEKLEMELDFDDKQLSVPAVGSRWPRENRRPGICRCPTFSRPSYIFISNPSKTFNFS
jgi:hypothetical protein